MLVAVQESHLSFTYLMDVKAVIKRHHAVARVKQGQMFGIQDVINYIVNLFKITQPNTKEKEYVYKFISEKME